MGNSEEDIFRAVLQIRLFNCPFKNDKKMHKIIQRCHI